MILGSFDDHGRPFVQGRLFIPRLRVEGYIDFLVDTGADFTAIHPRDGQRIDIPYSKLRKKSDVSGIGGDHEYYHEPGMLLFDDGSLLRVYILEIAIAKPSKEIETLPSLIGRPLLNSWRMRHDPYGGRLEVVAKNADVTLRADLEDIRPPF